MHYRDCVSPRGPVTPEVAGNYTVFWRISYTLSDLTAKVWASISRKYLSRSCPRSCFLR
ncbi:protein of unknown function (plasmid) [Pararobbsia alpina]